MSIYREYDIRGIVGRELVEERVKKIGYFLGLEIKKYGTYASLGYDARVHSIELFSYLTSGLNMAGVVVLDMGMVPTPVNYFSNYVEFDGKSSSGSIMITGSHNPPEYNGFKITIDKKPFFGEDIYALGRAVEASNLEISSSKEVVKIDAKERYIDYLADEFKALGNMNKSIVYDTGNGVGGVVLPELFKRLNISAKGLYIEPDGTFPNHHPDPSEEHNLLDIKELLSTEGDIAFAYDGDADRIAVLTKKSNIKGDMLALMLSKPMSNPTVVGEVKCSQIMYDEIERRGGRAVMYKTGHSNLKVKLKEIDADLAAEVSGHIFFNDRYFGYDDAIYTTFRVLELLNDGVNFDAELEALPKLFSTEEIKIKTTEESKFSTVKRLKELLINPPSDFPKIRNIIDIDGVRVVFQNGWGLVRASNTTPVLVTRFEANSLDDAKLYERALNKLIEQAKKES